MDPPVIAPEEVLAAAKSFPRRTTLGWGAFHPGLLLLLDRPFAERAAEALAAWERDPKPTGLVSVYFDISEFYERIGRELLRDAAQAQGFSIGLAKALRAAHAGPRRATVDGA
eukprot:9498423-Pyramimonas_sp.AAC.1